MTAVELGAHPPVAMPATLARRPLWKGRFPIPFVMFLDEDGVPDFRVNDEERRTQSIQRRLCALCGAPLRPSWTAWIGGPLCEEYRLFIDGPMHVDCARFAFTICPYLASPHNARHADVAAVHARHAGADVELHTEEASGDQRPAKMGLFFARAYEVVRLPDRPGLFFYIPEIARTEWYA